MMPEMSSIKQLLILLNDHPIVYNASSPNPTELTKYLLSEKYVECEFDNNFVSYRITPDGKEFLQNTKAMEEL